jgi:hypothetical protein
MAMALADIKRQAAVMTAMVVTIFACRIVFGPGGC